MAVSHIFTSPIADKTGTVTIWDGATTASVAATDIVRPGNWNSVHNQYYTLTGNTTNASTASGSNVVFSAAGPSLTLGGSTGSIVFSTPPHGSSWQFPGGFENTITLTLNMASISHAVAFMVAEPGSFSFIRLPILMSNNSTSLATTAATLSASVNVCTTYNAAVYSMGAGANSRSLVLVASGSNSWNFQNQINVAVNGTQYSQSMILTYAVEGNTTTFSTSTARSTSTYNYSSGAFSDFTGNRFLDINFANSLSAGRYWLVFGGSTNSASNSTGVSGASQNRMFYSNHYGMSQVNSVWGVMGSSNLTSGGLLGVGSFSTAGGGTTTSFPISAISTSASQPILWFQMLRSA